MGGEDPYGLRPVTDVVKAKMRWAQVQLCLVHAWDITLQSLSFDSLLVSWLVWRVFFVGEFVVQAAD